jgi:hypothetical protein
MIVKRELLMLAQQTLIGWEPVNYRIIPAKFTTKKDIKLNIHTVLRSHQ